MEQFDEVDFMDPNFTMKFSEDDVWHAINTKVDQTRSDRIRRALFPETLNQSEINNILHLRIHPEVPSALEQLSQPAQDLKFAIEELLEYVHDVELATKIASEVTNLLKNEDLEVVRNAAELVLDLSYSEAPAQVVIGHPHLLATLEMVLDKAGGSKMEEQIKKAGAGAMLNLTKYEKGRYVIFESGGIPYLVKLLGAQPLTVTFYATQSLHNLLQYLEGAKAAIISAGGIQRMVPLLQLKDIKFLAMLMDCLQMLCFKASESKLAVRNCKGPKHILAILKRNPSDKKLLFTMSRLLKVLSTCVYNKEDMADQGGFYLIAKRLPQMREESTFKNFLTTLRNISDAKANFYIDHEILDIILKQLESSNETVVQISAGILGNLTSERPSKKVAVFECNGVEVILRALDHPNRLGTTQMALILTLRHMSARHRLGRDIRAEIRKLGGLNLIMHILLTSTDWVVLSPTIGLIRNLANMTQNHKDMEDFMVVVRLCNLLSHTVNALALLKENKREDDDDYHIKNPKDSELDGVDLHDILIDCIGTLALLVHRPSLKTQIEGLEILELLRELEDREDEDVKMVVDEFFNAYNDTYTFSYDSHGRTLSRDSQMIDDKLDDLGYEIVDDKEFVGQPGEAPEAVYENTSAFSTLNRSIVVTDPNDRAYLNDSLRVQTAPSRSSSYQSITSSATMDMSQSRNYYGSNRKIVYEDNEL
ncbi:hypothetical protein TCAL_12016 [Tigriopus californicus]|uniref:Armadillo segment polarity protein n=1 Tax=Tigriopus californicus TaxID=6832 RepID=A0A553NU90_TIGCA|nr:armadillo segment polarity protein-like [Tigriopus californicus]TRY69010.1 hypothetical protein TCAL_12016 [Tigriopus californicus]|eukprot:TCALIF_12016-PA protein Name:"Similar to arm Armadillo segment polarity protein (Drosophila pseudoobscura pseudoobscura)" AED:0.00 eAED:0.00 QI:68/1/1/1/0.83/0.71/7/85/706